MAFILRGSIPDVTMVGKRNRDGLSFLSFDVYSGVDFNLDILRGTVTQILGRGGRSHVQLIPAH